MCNVLRITSTFVGIMLVTIICPCLLPENAECMCVWNRIFTCFYGCGTSFKTASIGIVLKCILENFGWEDVDWIRLA